MGDIGARLLAKALQINNKLRSISLDRNNITLQGKIPFSILFLKNIHSYTTSSDPKNTHTQVITISSMH